MYSIQYIQVHILGHQGDESNAEVIIYAALTACCGTSLPDHCSISSLDAH